MLKKLGFSLIELVVTIAIISILTMLGISGYMQSLMKSRRNEATRSLQGILLSMNNNASTNINCPYNTTIQMDATSKTCITENGFYVLNYDPTGFSTDILPSTIIHNMVINEKLILKATARNNQTKDNTNCLTIYLTDMNNILPKECFK